MITTAIAVNTDGATVLSAGATYGILLAILVAHGIVCSAATNVLARLNLADVGVNRESDINLGSLRVLTGLPVGTTIAAVIALLVCAGDSKVSTKDAFTLFENNSGWTNSKNLFVPF
jgi:hypothetical protein